MTESPTRLKDLARMAGVSIATVSRALNDHPSVNLKTKRQVWALARAHDYPFRRTMPAGPIGAEATIAIVVTRPQGRADRLDDPFALDLVAGVTEAARERGCDVLLSHVHPDGYDELEAIMETSRADGVVFLGQSLLHPAFNRLAARERRFVVWGAALPGQAYCSVGSDNPLGGRRATAHLLRLGRRAIVFLGDTDAVEAAQRLQGWRAAHAEAGLATSEALVTPAHFEVEAAEAAVDGLLARGIAFDGVVAASDLIALGAMRALARAGRRVPADVSVVGYDDVPFARYAAPALTTVRQDTGKAGRLLVSKLLDGGDGDMRPERVPTELVVRESCGG